MQALCLEPCCSAYLGFKDAKLYEEQGLHRCICSGTRLLPACFCSAAQSNKASTLPRNLLHCTLGLFMQTYMKSKTFIGVSAVADGCCRLFLLSSTEQQGKHFALKPAALYSGSMDANVYEEESLHMSDCSGTRRPSACSCSAALSSKACVLP